MIVIEGGRRLSGRVRIRGAKNAALPVLAGALLTGEKVWLEEVPALEDVATMGEVLTHLGASVEAEAEGTMAVTAADLVNSEAPYELVRRMRASFLAMGPLLARRGLARIALPGGCAIGARPLDLHLKGFAALGAEIVAGYGYVEGRALKRLRGAEVYLDFPSVGATENLMMAATLAEGHTVIANAAKEPEIVDLATFLNALGARVRGAGTDTIRIEGVPELRGARHRIIPDRIEAGTYLMAVGAAGGEVSLENVVCHHLEPVVAKAREAGLEIQVQSGAVEGENEILRVRAGGRPRSADIITMPYPGFPTDLQPPWMALMAVSSGSAAITENVFEDRFRHVDELRRMGARVRVQGRVAEVAGVPRLTGARVRATDLRAGAALVVAGLAAEGVTEIGYVHHLDRGYADLEENLRGLGATVERQDIPLPAADTA